MIIEVFHVLILRLFSPRALFPFCVLEVICTTLCKIRNIKVQRKRKKKKGLVVLQDYLSEPYKSQGDWNESTPGMLSTFVFPLDRKWSEECAWVHSCVSFLLGVKCSKTSRAAAVGAATVLLKGFTWRIIKSLFHLLKENSICSKGWILKCFLSLYDSAGQIWGFCSYICHFVFSLDIYCSVKQVSMAFKETWNGWKKRKLQECWASTSEMYMDWDWGGWKLSLFFFLNGH